MPQVHGASRDALDHLRRVLDIELNSATDNPLVFPGGGEVPTDALATGGGLVISGGNFHGEPVALALDFAKLAIAELGSISERRVALLLDPRLNDGLPAFLGSASGLDSGLMILQYTAAALVSENKVLAHPASADSIPTSANQEDHVSMGSIAARHARRVLEHVERVLAIELLCAAQGLDLRLAQLPGTRPGTGVGRGARPGPGRRARISTATASPDRTWPPRPRSCAPGALADLAATPSRWPIRRGCRRHPVTPPRDHRVRPAAADDRGPGPGALGAIDGPWVAGHRGRAVARCDRGGLRRPGIPRTSSDVGSALCTPGLVDPHTHLCFAGDRSDEAAARSRGERYTGGGILRTVAADDRRHGRGAGAADPGPAASVPCSSGTTTIEVKSGYGLVAEQELRLLRLIGDGRAVAALARRADLSRRARGARRARHPRRTPRRSSTPCPGSPREADQIDVFCEPTLFDLG